MRITGCHIENFGKLAGADINFNRNLTVIAHENGWGKSTLMSFIRVMFYGFEGENKRTNNEKERVKFRPWQGGVYGGSIVFESDGKTYVLTRTFGTKADEDTFELRNVETNLPCGDYSDNIGQELFKIDRDSFTRTVFISQEEIESGATDDINAKMGNLADNTNDINNYESADAKLKNALNSMSLTRATGSLNKLQKEIADIRTELKKADVLNDSVERIQDYIHGISVEKKRLADEQQELSDKINEISKTKDLAAKAAEYRRLLNEEKEAREILNNARCAFDNEKPLTDEDLSDMNKTIDVCVKLSDVCTEKDKQTDRLLRKYELFKLQQDQISKSKTGSGLLLIGIIMLLAGGIFSVLTYMNSGEFMYPGLIAAGIGIVLAIVGIVIKSNNKVRENVISEDELDAIKKEINLYDREITEFLKRNNKNVGNENIKKVLRDIQNETIEKLSLAKVNIANYDNALNNLNKATDNLKVYENSNDTDMLKNIDPDKELPDLSAFAERFSSNAAIIDQDNEKESKYRAQLADCQNELDELEIKKAQLDSISAKYDDGVKRFGYIATAREHLSKAKENMTARYVDPLKESFGRYYQIATGTAAEAFLLDANAQLTYNMFGAQRALSSLSRGYKDLASICLRLAFIDAMYKNEKPMIVLDDAFVNLDAANTEGAMKLLDVISERYQVIYFTRE